MVSLSVCEVPRDKVELEIAVLGVDELIPVTIIRDEIPIYSVLAKFVMADGTGYILINRFSATTSDEFLSAAEGTQVRGMAQLVIDLRNNSGGYMDEVVKMVDEMLPGGRSHRFHQGPSEERQRGNSQQGQV